MKVCHVASNHYSNDNRIYAKECISLANVGFEVFFVVEGFSYVENGVNIVGVGKAPSSRIKRILSFTKHVYNSALDLNADIYHLHDPELLPYALKLKNKGYKVIFDCHENILDGTFDKYYIPKLLRPILGFMFKQYAKRVLPKMDALVTVTPVIVEQLAPLNPNTFMVTNYPKLLGYKNTSNREKGKICFTGMLSDLWNIRFVMDTIAEIDGVDFYICGPEINDYLNILKQSPGWSKTKYLGQLKVDEARQVQLSSSIGICLVIYDSAFFFKRGSLGNTKIYEYMMNGLPVICTDVDVWKEMIDKYHCGIYVNPYDKEALKYAIKYLINNPDKAKLMGQNGRKAVEQEYNWATQEKVLLDLYSSLKQQI